MSISVSYSALECFEQCSEKYRLRYVEKLYSDKIPSPLFFGSAIDAAVELLLLKKKVNLTDEELDLQLTQNAKSVFDSLMREQNGQLLERNLLCEYFNSDFDPSLLNADDISYLVKSYPYVTDFVEFFESCKAVFRARKELKDSDKLLFNNLCWRSLYRKGELLIDAYERDILPEIHEVFEIQKTVLLTNESGDRLRGKIDFIASFTSDPTTKYIIDNKTSSEPYKADSVANSIQLAIYCEAEGTNKAAYAVMEKKIRVRDPKARTQLIKDNISEEHFQKTFDIVEKKLNTIAEGVYQKKANPKECFHFGKRCDMYGLCWSDSMDGLKRKE
jgi:CRISPR/Cas system-associated exonuclease Cas4 (RecB family)